MKKSLKTVAIVGFVGKGFIYFVVGLLSLLAALSLGGKSSGTNSAMKFLEKQPFGEIMLIVLGLGLVCYSFWMFVQCFKDPENKGTGKKALLQRASCCTTGIIYTFLSFLCFYHIFTYSSGSSKSSYLQLLGPSLLSTIFIAVGVILGIQCIVLCIAVFKGNILGQFNIEGEKGSGMLRVMGKFGFYARAFVVGIIAYFFLRAGIYSGSHKMKGIQDAFSFLHESFLGTLLMGLTALGFICYGLFYILLSKYRTFED